MSGITGQFVTHASPFAHRLVAEEITTKAGSLKGSLISELKPEADQQWERSAAIYWGKQSVPVKRGNRQAASDTYARTFQSEINKDASVAPTLGSRQMVPSGLI